MLFNSPAFVFLFLPICLAGFYSFGCLDRSAAVLWLVVCSLVFYGWWQPAAPLLLMATVLFNYAFGTLIMRTAKRRPVQLSLLTIGITADLALLGCYKYLLPLLQYLNAPQAATPASDILFPLGISFFTFTQIMYLIECQTQVKAERQILDYALFTTFFPNLISGPILRYGEMKPQLAARATYKLRTENLSVGATIFVLGLGKKALLADPIAPYADAGYLRSGELQLLGAWGTVLAFALQLYFDFSGYSDMAIGLARMFGIRLPLNFASPYKAASIVAFWQRWNMTLTRFFNLYLYNPLALWIMRRQAARRVATGRATAVTPSEFATAVAFPTFVTMTLIGVWHGAGLQFLYFGLLHATYLTVYHAWRSFGPKQRKHKEIVHGPISQLRRAAAVLATFIAVVLAQVFFRADSVAAAIDMFAGLFGLHGFAWTDWELPLTATTGSAAGWPQIALLLAVVWGLPNTQQIMAHFAPCLDPVTPPAGRAITWRPSLPWAIAVGLIFIFAIEGISQSRSFLYFQF